MRRRYHTTLEEEVIDILKDIAREDKRQTNEIIEDLVYEYNRKREDRKRDKGTIIYIQTWS